MGIQISAVIILFFTKREEFVMGNGAVVENAHQQGDEQNLQPKDSKIIYTKLCSNKWSIVWCAQ